MKQHGHSRDPGETGVVLGQVGAAGGGEKWSRCEYAFQTRIKIIPVCCEVRSIGIEDGPKPLEGPRLESCAKGTDELSLGHAKLEASNGRSDEEAA